VTGPIVRAAIHPAIGLARVGSSPDEFLVAPQVPFPPPRAAGSSHDPQGRLKREAVEFRVFGYDEDGRVVTELNADNAQVTWTVHVANAKAAWFKFRHAMDVLSLADTVVERRNPALMGPAQRRQLVIDPGPRSISGRDQRGVPYRFDTGHFKGTPVVLGEVRTDERGRLRFLSGLGVSQSPNGAPPYVADQKDGFGNADDWYDDIADGPVDALVVFEGRQIPTEGAWVASAPPNYAPDLKSWRTLYELIVDVYIGEGWLEPSSATSFTDSVYPTLARLSALQWVNKASAAVFGHDAPFDFADPGLVERLAKVQGGPEVDVYKPLRMSIFKIFREQEPYPSDPAAWPWLYGDAFGSSPREATEPSLHLALDANGQRLRHLRNWVEGKFEADWGLKAPPPATISAYPVEEQPAALDRAALDFCVADAFHPGIEFTWPMRHASIYTKPFRIRRAISPEPDYGTHLDVPTVLGSAGPLHGQTPGSLTRWMLLPWQIDTGGCLAGYDLNGVFDAPSFWPARVPNFVLSHANYLLANDESLSAKDRLNAFQRRRSWFEPLHSPSTDWGSRLLTMFGGMGVVEAYPRFTDHPRLPPVMYVETVPATHDLAQPVPPADAETAGIAPASARTEEDRDAQAAGFVDDADRRAMRAMRFGR
jgi:hypothetical protein